MKRAFVYCRVSTEEQSQDDHYSLALQEERCRDYAKSKSHRSSAARPASAIARHDPIIKHLVTSHHLLPRRFAIGVYPDLRPTTRR